MPDPRGQILLQANRWAAGLLAGAGVITDLLVAWRPVPAGVEVAAALLLLALEPWVRAGRLPLAATATFLILLVGLSGSLVWDGSRPAILASYAGSLQPVIIYAALAFSHPRVPLLAALGAAMAILLGAALVLSRGADPDRTINILVSALAWTAGTGVVTWIVIRQQGLLLRLSGEETRRARQAEERLRAVYDTVEDGIFVHDAATGQVLEVNRRATEMSGFSMEELLRLPPDAGSEGVPPFSGAEARDWLIRARDQGPQLFPWRARRKDGSLMWVEVSLRRSEMAGRPVLLAVVRDIDARIRAEEDRKRDEERIRTLFDAPPYPIFSKDAELRYRDCNAAFATYLGLPRQRILGATVYDVSPPEKAAVYDQADRKLIQHGGQQVYEALVRGAGGQDRRVIFHKQVLKGAGGPQGILGIMVDVTEQRALEERLRQAEKLEAIGLLAGGVAHDFNNQLAGILGHAELLAGELSGDPRLRHWADTIATAAQRSADLTRQLLAFARKGRLLNVPIDCHRLVDEVVVLLTRTLDRRISIHRDLAAERCTVQGDPGQLESALLNLAINARDAMPEGGTLTFASTVVRLGMEDARVASGELVPGDHLRLSVVDTGTGFAPELLNRIFDPFFTTKGPGQGTGLGLPSVYGTLRSHHGAVEVDSTLGRGSTFSLLLPLATAEAVGPVERKPPPERPLRVLVVDDEEVVRKMLVEQLRRLGHQGEPCPDGPAALALLPNGIWDLVLLDLMMPHLSGAETFRSLRRIRPDQRILLVSGYAFDQEAQALLTEGAAGFLHKPFTGQELATALDQALRPGGA